MEIVIFTLICWGAGAVLFTTAWIIASIFYKR